MTDNPEEITGNLQRAKESLIAAQELFEDRHFDFAASRRLSENLA